MSRKSLSSYSNLMFPGLKNRLRSMITDKNHTVDRTGQPHVPETDARLAKCQTVRSWMQMDTSDNFVQ